MRSLARTAAGLFLGLLLIAPGSALAQSVDIGSDFVSRYVWRGYDFGESFSVQPYLEYSQGGFALGTWASYAISPDAAGANEHDLYASYSFGAVSIGVTDYYFPGPGAAGFFDYDSDGAGAHVIEPNVSLGGTESFPVTFYGAVNAYNDPDNSLYLQASYPFSLDGTDLSVTLGAVGNESAYYGTDGFAVTNIALSASYAIPITDGFELPLSATYVLNPDTERTFLVFGISL